MAARLTTYLVVAIVATTLIAGLIVGAQRDDNDGPVDLIVRNGRVYTADRKGTMAEAVAIRGNRILQVGSDREIGRLQRPQTVVVDARGAAVLPGFNDSRADLVSGGLSLRKVDLSGAADASEMLERIVAWRQSNPAAPWVVGKGWSAEHFRNGVPSKQLLDSVVADRPAILYGADETAIWVNSQALRLAGITRKSQDPPNGTILREGRGGEPAGVLTGSAAALVSSLLPAPTRDDRAHAIRAAIAHAHSLGVTSVHHTADGDDTLELYESIRRSGDLTLRVYAAIPIDEKAVPRTEADLEKYDETRKRYADDPLFKSGALSIRLDGPVTKRDAAMLEPYSESESAGVPRFDPDDLNRLVRLADAAGWQVITEANGDRAVRMALNAYAHAVRSNRPPARGRRHRIDGAAVVDAADMNRFGPLGVVVSMQPALRSGGTDARDRLARGIGPARAAAAFAFAGIAGETRLLLGSGWPAGTLDPLRALDMVVTGSPQAEAAEDTARTGRRLELKAAIDAYTSMPAWASFDNQRKGVIAPGMLADLVVLSDDIFAANAQSPGAASVALTIFDGKVVFRRVTRAETEPAPSLQH